jgi:PAS domain S-box-containing protein
VLGVLTAAMVTAGSVLASLAVYVWRRRGATSGLSLAILLGAVAWWAATYAVELSTHDLGARTRWGDLKYVGVCLLPPAWLVFVLRYTGRGRWVSTRLLLWLAVEPVAVWMLLALPATHDLLRFYPPSAAQEELPVVGTGPLFWVHLAYANVTVLTATVLFVSSMVRLARVYLTSALVLVAAALLPWAANLLHNFAVGPFVKVDLTPFAFIVTGGVLVWGLYRERLIDLASVAWGLVVETTPDAVILLDAFGRVVDVNPATTRLLGRTRADLVGLELDAVLDAPELGDGRIGGEPDTESEMAIVVDRQVRHFDVRRHDLSDTTGPSGQLVTLRDITPRKENEARLRQLLAERTRVATALQASLLPTRLPAIPQCEFGAVYEPAGDGHEIGGDFYDVFPQGCGRWGIALGDVSGKGAEAAAATALIRYTLRALAIDTADPVEVLTKLNSVLLDEGTEERFCTLVYAVAELEPSGLHLRLCLGGHHPPLLRRRDGRVEHVGTPGTALGLVPDPELVEASLNLHPGDLLCLFTDGLLEARRGLELFGSERAVSLLDRLDGRPAQQVVEELAISARDFQQGQLADDLAVLAISVRPPVARPVCHT